MVMTDAAIKAALSEEQAVAMTIWAEARAELIEGQVAVGNVLRNRLLQPRRFGSSWKEVCFARKQFSCWNLGEDTNHRMLIAKCDACLKGREPWPAQQMWIAEGIISGAASDRTGGATHYYSPEGMIPRNAVPSWAEGKTPVAVIQRHRFYKGV
jgi:N-acetylmuramoyl-L-alanine amidase